MTPVQTVRGHFQASLFYISVPNHLFLGSMELYAILFIFDNNTEMTNTLKYVGMILNTFL